MLKALFSLVAQMTFLGKMRFYLLTLSVIIFFFAFLYLLFSVSITAFVLFLSLFSLIVVTFAYTYGFTQKNNNDRTSSAEKAELDLHNNFGAYSYALFLKKFITPRQLMVYILRTRSKWGLEIFANVVTTGTLGQKNLVDFVEKLSTDEQNIKFISNFFNLDNLAMWARATLSLEESEKVKGIIYLFAEKILAKKKNFESLNSETQQHIITWLIKNKKYTLSRKLLYLNGLSNDIEYLQLADTFITELESNSSGDNDEIRAIIVNSIFTKSGLPRFDYAQSSYNVFGENVVAAPKNLETKIPKISVIMTCYKPNKHFEVAVNSILNQTWQNLELIIVDDNSPRTFDEYLNTICSKDSRIIFIKSETNNGTYIAKNIGLQSSDGELITFQDSDDWSHPFRLEIQANDLINNKNQIGNICNSVRITEEGKFIHGRDPVIKIAESSLMFRKSETLNLIGYFDQVRRGADSEFRRRLERASKTKISTVPIKAPLLMVLQDSQTLSGSDFADGWIHPERTQYKNSSENLSIDSLKYPFLPATNLFSKPPHIRGKELAIHKFDFIFVIDAEDNHESNIIKKYIDSFLKKHSQDEFNYGFITIPKITAKTLFRKLDPKLETFLFQNGVTQLSQKQLIDVNKLIVWSQFQFLGISELIDNWTISSIVFVAQPNEDAKFLPYFNDQASIRVSF